MQYISLGTISFVYHSDQIVSRIVYHGDRIESRIGAQSQLSNDQ